MTNRRASPSKSLALNFTHGGNVPEWIEVLPAGPEIIGRDGRYWIIDDPASIIARSELPLHVDYEHASEVRAPKGEEAPAAGWIDKLEVRNGQIWAHVDWTPRASAMIAERDYRFISPTFWFDSNTLRIVGLVSVALTNRPNLTMTALNRADASGHPERDESGADDDETSADASGHPKRNTGETTMDKEQLKALCKKLGLQEEASATAILSAVDTLVDDKAKALNAAQTPPLEKFVPRAEFDKIKADLDTANNAIKSASEAKREAEITSAVDDAVKAGKVIPAQRDYYLAQCRKDGGLEEFKKFVETMPVLTGVSDLDTKRASNTGGKGELTAEEKAVCAAMGLSEEAFKKAAA